MTAIVYSNHSDEDQLRPSGGSSIHFLQKGPSEITAIRLNEDVAIDLGPAEEVVGIEVLDASEHMVFDWQTPVVVLENLQPV